MADQDEDFAAMFAETAGSKPHQKRPRVGDFIKGAVISIGKDAVFLDVGGKAEGTLDRSQVSIPRANCSSTSATPSRPASPPTPAAS
ncbi:MAG: S1 RNA-binding domain-containing protein [Kofleriaceae bacterium]